MNCNYYSKIIKSREQEKKTHTDKERMIHCLRVLLFFSSFSKALQIILQGQMSYYITVFTSTVLFVTIKQQSISKSFSALGVSRLKTNKQKQQQTNKLKP